MVRLNKQQWERLGGHSNKDLTRTQVSNGGWAYWLVCR